MKSQDLDWIFFDVGGVLVDHGAFEKWRKESALSVAQQYNPRLNTKDLERAYAAGSAMTGDLSVNMMAELLPGHAKLVEATEAFLQRRRAEINYLKQSEIRPEALEVVRKLHRHYKLGIIANQPKDMRQKLGVAGLAQHFDNIGLSDDHGFHKPDPRLFAAIFAQTGADPKRSLMIDDNIERGLLPAHELGMKTCWYKLLERPRPDWVNFQIANLKDLVSILL